jgi:hypothetical protein
MTLRAHLYLMPFQQPAVSDASGRSVRPLPSDVKQETASTTLHSEPFVGEFDRLSSLTLAAGKDFNDELTLILNHAEVSLDLVGADHPASEGLVELQHAAMRCAETTRGLLLLSRRAQDTVRYAKVRASDANPGDREFL